MGIVQFRINRIKYKNVYVISVEGEAVYTCFDFLQERL